MNAANFCNGRWRGLVLGLTLVPLTAACDAQFVDLRDPSNKSSFDGGIVLRSDAGVVTDGGDSADDGGGAVSVGIVKEGVWTGRSDYRASGQATIERLDNGQVQLRFSSDFSVSRVPGPVVVLSYRQDIGRNIDPSQGDVELGRLLRNSGSQTYPVPAGVDDRLFAWVYCKPFGLEVGRAELETP
ncbi:MAG: hypothetical protein AAF449_14800 [Myxococcota bacterium]